jgi:hypothetical protein
MLCPGSCRIDARDLRRAACSGFAAATVTSCRSRAGATSRWARGPHGATRGASGSESLSRRHRARRYGQEGNLGARHRDLSTTAISFNLALILIGLDREHAVHPRFHFDPTPPKGDPVEIWVEWDENGTTRKVRAEQLVYNERTQHTIPEGPWVYTGSVFVEQVHAYLADIEGALISFVHTPAPILENPTAVMGPYGANRLNPALNLKAGTAVTLTVRALQQENK